ncbi:lipopolysaccharide biosynthesis protein [Cytobacillus firmus]|uniref:lipopolysaccharide biosynthesis protein n=1 Tax=Cytobacillus firmus TaxID=1399 RepID=UPI003001FE7E
MVNIRKIIHKVWDSPTFTTWGSFFVKAVSVSLVLSLVLNRFTSSEVALWFLFSTIFSLQNIIDLGFNPTFSRAIAFARGGANIDEIKDFRQNRESIREGFINISTLSGIIPTMDRIYKYLSIVLLVVMGIIGTISLQRPIDQTGNENLAWIAWGIVLFSSFFNLRGNKYSAYLIGMNFIALVRRWEILFSIGRLITQLSILLFDANILSLIIATHVWTILNVLRNRMLCNKIENGIFKDFETLKFNKLVFNSLWSSAWRSGIGMGLGYGIVQTSGIIYAQFESSKEVASFLLSLKIMETIVQFSQAPFYSKLPLLATLRSRGDIDQQRTVAKRGMTLSYFSFVAACVFFGVFSDPLLLIINSDTEFVSLQFWGLLCLANLFHRYGAMHIQLYSTTNHIIWHIADGISGIIYIMVSLLLFNLIGIYAFVVGMLCGYLGFYSWYSAKHSYNSFKLQFWNFDKNAALSFVILLIFTITTISFT